MAARTAQELNLSDIANTIGISLNTVKSWLSVLQASGVIYFLFIITAIVTKQSANALSVWDI
jgi:predicted AAA+ superfamily ATPase